MINSDRLGREFGRPRPEAGRDRGERFIGFAGCRIRAPLRARPPTPSRLDAQVIAELRRLGGLQKHLYNGGRDRGRQYAEILLELTDAIRRVG